MRALLALTLMCTAAFAQAAVQTREIPYQDADGNRLVGYYAYDDAVTGKRPGIVVVHEWWGLNDYAKRRARDLAALGYNALAIDMYGDGKHTEHPQDAQAFMAAALKDPKAAARRFDAGLALLKLQPNTNKHDLGAVGCDTARATGHRVVGLCGLARTSGRRADPPAGRPPAFPALADRAGRAGRGHRGRVHRAAGRAAAHLRLRRPTRP